MLLTDTHCHLDLHRFDPDREAVLQRAIQAGVRRILIPGLTMESSISAIRLASNHPMLFAATGIHPTEVSSVEHMTLNELRKLTKNPKVKAIGEIGLDYYWDATPHDLQKKVLKEQLDLAAEVGYPVVIHFREKGDALDGPCAADLLKILEAWTSDLRAGKDPLAERPGVLHSFSGSREMAGQAIALNFYLGVSGPVTYRPSRQEVIAGLPLERILIETDAPFLAPAPHRGKRNEPAFTTLITDKIAACLACSLEEVADVTSANAQRLFSWE